MTTDAEYPPIISLETDDTTAFLRAARSGNLEKVIEYLDTNNLDINTANSNGLNAMDLAAKDGHVEIVTELLKRGAKVDAATKKGNTALHIASLAGQTEVVRILLQYGASVNIQSQNGFTPLYMAAQENHDQVVKLLLSNGANQSLATEDGFTPLAVAMQQGHDKVVSVLLENDSKGKVRLPALHIAAKKDDCKAADLLLQNDHKPDVTSKSGFTPLHIAAHYGNEEIAKLLIKRGADVNYLAKHNISPLHVAAKWGKNNMVKILLENSATIDAKTRDGLTPLHCAARSGHEEVVSTLLEHEAPISARTKNGLAPLHMASQGDHVDAARVLLYHRAPVDEVTIDYLTSLHVAAHCGHVRVAKLLLDRKADPNARALNGFTPLHIACKKNRIKVVELLLKHGASIESTTESGLTPLHVASFMGCMNIVIFLLQHEANPDVPTVRGETPLHLAARANQTDIIRILLRNGAKVDARAREEQTPLHIASRLGNVDIVMLLLQHGAAVDTTTKDMYTALHIAAKEGQEEVAAILVENHASVKAATKNGFTPLHIAAKYGNMNVAKILLQKDSKLDAQGKNNITPLHLACHYDHSNVANMILEKGASPHIASQNGHTPLHISARKNQMDIASTLLEHGADPNVQSKAGFTPLQLSAQKGHYDMTNLLIEHGADPNHKAKNGLTALHLCAQEDFIRVASVLVKNGANVESETETGYRPIHVAAHFGNLSMIRFLLKHNAQIDVRTNQNYTPLHQAAQQGHAHIVSALLEGNASHNARTTDGLTALNVAQKLGYISVMEVLKGLSYDTLTPDNRTWEEKYKVIAPESLQETSFMSDSDDEGVSDGLISEQPYRYLTADLMKSLRDDSLPIDVTRDDPIHRQVSKEEKQEFVQSNNYCLAENFDTNDSASLARLHFRSFLVSFLVDARGGAMKGCRHSGIRIIVPPRRATMPIRVTCRLIKPSKVANPPSLMEGEALATRIIEMGPVGASFLGPVLIDVPHFASVQGKEREIIILRSENGETWKEHENSPDNDDTLYNTPHGSKRSANTQMSASHSGRITRILTTEFPQYFAIVTRIKQEVHVIGADGGILISSVANHVQAVFPPGALTKKIKVGLQAHVIPAELTAKLLGNCVAVSPVITIEPRRRKFHKPITLTIPVPQAANKGMINQYAGETPTLRLLCSIAGGTSEAQWEDVTGSTPLTFMNDRVSFTTTVSARFWLMDCRNISEVPKMATDLYKESLFVPYITNFVIYTKRMDVLEATLRILCMTDGKEGLHTLERQEEFLEIVKSRDVEALDGKDLYIEFSGNLVPVTKSGVQLKFTFKAFRQNRLSFHVKVRDPLLDPVARMMFMRDPKVAKGEPAQQPICVLNIVLPESITQSDKKRKEYEDSNEKKKDRHKSSYTKNEGEKGDRPKSSSPSESKFITDILQKEQTDAATIHESLAQKAASPLESVDASYPSNVSHHHHLHHHDQAHSHPHHHHHHHQQREHDDLSPSAERQTYTEKRKFWEDITRKRDSYQRSESEMSRTSQLTVNESDSEYCVQNIVSEEETPGELLPVRSETLEDLNVPDISECSVAEKAHYFEEQIQRESQLSSRPTSKILGQEQPRIPGGHLASSSTDKSSDKLDDLDDEARADPLDDVAFSERRKKSPRDDERNEAKTLDLDTEQTALPDFQTRDEDLHRKEIIIDDILIPTLDETRGKDDAPVAKSEARDSVLTKSPEEKFEKELRIRKLEEKVSERKDFIEKLDEKLQESKVTEPGREKTIAKPEEKFEKELHIQKLEGKVSERKDFIEKLDEKLQESKVTEPEREKTIAKSEEKFEKELHIQKLEEKVSERKDFIEKLAEKLEESKVTEPEREKTIVKPEEKFEKELHIQKLEGKVSERKDFIEKLDEKLEESKVTEPGREKTIVKLEEKFEKELHIQKLEGKVSERKDFIEKLDEKLQESKVTEPEREKTITKPEEKFKKELHIQKLEGKVSKREDFIEKLDEKLEESKVTEPEREKTIVKLEEKFEKELHIQKLEGKVSEQEDFIEKLNEKLEKSKVAEPEKDKTIIISEAHESVFTKTPEEKLKKELLVQKLEEKVSEREDFIEKLDEKLEKSKIKEFEREKTIATRDLEEIDRKIETKKPEALEPKTEVRKEPEMDKTHLEATIKGPDVEKKVCSEFLQHESEFSREELADEEKWRPAVPEAEESKKLEERKEETGGSLKISSPPSMIPRKIKADGIGREDESRFTDEKEKREEEIYLATEKLVEAEFVTSEVETKEITSPSEITRRESRIPVSTSKTDKDLVSAKSPVSPESTSEPSREISPEARASRIPVAARAEKEASGVKSPDEKSPREEATSPRREYESRIPKPTSVARTQEKEPRREIPKETITEKSSSFQSRTSETTTTTTTKKTVSKTVVSQLGDSEKITELAETKIEHQDKSITSSKYDRQESTERKLLGDTGEETFFKRESSGHTLREKLSETATTKETPDEKIFDRKSETKKSEVNELEEIEVTRRDGKTTVDAAARTTDKVDKDRQRIQALVDDSGTVVRAKDSRSSKEREIEARLSLERGNEEPIDLREELASAVVAERRSEEATSSEATLVLPSSLEGSRLSPERETEEESPEARRARELEARNVAETIIESIQTELAKRSESLQAAKFFETSDSDSKEFSDNTLDLDTKESEVFHDRIADDLLRKFENIMDKRSGSQSQVIEESEALPERLRSAVASHENLDKASNRGSLSVSEDFTKDEESTPYDREESFPSSSSQPKLVDRDMTMSPSSISDQIDLEVSLESEKSIEVESARHGVEKRSLESRESRDTTEDRSRRDSVPSLEIDEEPQRKDTLGDLSQKETREEFLRKDIYEESTKKDTRDEVSRKDIHDESLQKDIHEESLQKEIPEESSQKEILESSKKDIHEESLRKEIPEESTQKEIYEESLKKDTRDEFSRKDIHEESLRKEITEESSQKEILESSKKGIHEEDLRKEIPKESSQKEILKDISQKEIVEESLKNEIHEEYSKAEIHEEKSPGLKILQPIQVASIHESPAFDSLEQIIPESELPVSPPMGRISGNQGVGKTRSLASLVVRSTEYEIPSPSVLSPRLKLKELEIKPVNWMIGDEKIEVSETLQPSQAFDKELEEYQSSLKIRDEADGEESAEEVQEDDEEEEESRKKIRTTSVSSRDDESIGECEQESVTRSSEDVSAIDSVRETEFTVPTINVPRTTKFTVTPVPDQDFESELVENRLDVSCQELMDALQREYEAKTPTGDREDSAMILDEAKQRDFTVHSSTLVSDSAISQTSVIEKKVEEFFAKDSKIESEARDVAETETKILRDEESLKTLEEERKTETVSEAIEQPEVTLEEKKPTEILEKEIEKVEVTSKIIQDTSVATDETKQSNIGPKEPMEAKEPEVKETKVEQESVVPEEKTEADIVGVVRKITDEVKSEITLRGLKQSSPSKKMTKSCHDEVKRHEAASEQVGRPKKEDISGVDLSARYAITVLNQVVKKEIAEVKESLEAAKQDLIEELSENSETVFQIKDSPSEFQFKLEPESIPNDLALLYKPPSPPLEHREQEKKKASEESPIASEDDKSLGEKAPEGIIRDEEEEEASEEKIRRETTRAEKSLGESSSGSSEIKIVTELSDKEVPVGKKRERSIEVSEETSVSQTSPMPASRSSSDVDNREEIGGLLTPQPAPRKRQKPARIAKKVTSESDAGSSSGDSSNYQSCDYEIGSGSRPSSSDIEALQSTLPSGTVSEYESALMSIKHSSASRPTSQEYQSAVSTLSSRESMKSLNSLSSGHLGSIDSTGEVSETLVASEDEAIDDKDRLETNLDDGILEDEKAAKGDSDSSASSEIPMEDAYDKSEDVPCRMKRSSEMIFQQIVDEGATLEEEDPGELGPEEETRFDECTTEQLPSDTVAEDEEGFRMDSIFMSTDLTSEAYDKSFSSMESRPEVPEVLVEADRQPEIPALETHPEEEPDEEMEEDFEEEEAATRDLAEPEFPPGETFQSSIGTLLHQASTTSSTSGAMSFETVIEKEQKPDRHSPDSDSFELVDKPDMMDDFLVVEEVGREAEEFDSEGKSISIGSSSLTSVKKYDRELENLITSRTKEETEPRIGPGGSQARNSELFEFESEESPPMASNAEDQYSQSLSDEDNYEAKKWMEMQFQADPRAYDLEYDRGRLEDIKEEEVTDFEAGSSRFGSLGSHKGSIGSVGSMRGSYGSATDYELITGKKGGSKPMEHDNISLSSLQEFESLENAVALETSKKFQCGSQDSVNNGSLPRRYMTSRSGHGDDISLSSLKDFEGLEKACKEAHLIELRAREEEDLLDHESPENRYKLENLPRPKPSLAEPTSGAGSFNPSTSGSDDYEKRIMEIDEIIRIAQANVEKFDRQDDTTEDISQIEITDAERMETLAVTSVITTIPEVESDQPARPEANVMETSTDSLELEENLDPRRNPLCRSSDSLEMKTTIDYPSLSSDSLNNVRAEAAVDNANDRFNASRRISSDSLEMPVLEQQQPETDSHDRSSESHGSYNLKGSFDDSVEQTGSTTDTKITNNGKMRSSSTSET